MKAAYGAAALLLASSMAWGVPRQTISGTFQKGPAEDSVERVKDHGAIVIITHETATGSVLGGAFTGSAVYTTIREVINFNNDDGEFHINVTITKANGSTITIALDGITTGVTPESVTVPVSGTWKVIGATGQDAHLQGEGTFQGTEAFATGVTSGSFSGEIH